MSLQPPTKGETKAKPPKAEKEAKPPKEKKDRAPKADYGYRKGATLKLTGKEAKYTGQRAEWFETIKAFNGKKVEDWSDTRKDVKNGNGVIQSPRGWLRFYVKDGTVALEGGESPAPKKAKEDTTDEAKTA
jgi:hypothetical protein